VRDDSYAFWRRVRCIDFPRKFTINKTLKTTLAAEAPGILAWCVRQAVLYYQEGLPVPEAVRLTTEDYRSETDQVGEFTADCCVLRDDYSVRTGDLYAAYVGWTEDQHFTRREVLSHRMFSLKLKQRFEPARDRVKGRMFVGLRLRKTWRIRRPVTLDSRSDQ
jgi:putative DNA primase/helicase